MRAYMVYDRAAGSGEGACLVFAKTARDARKLAKPILGGWFNTEWFDIAVKWQRDLPDHLQALDTGEEQAIESPPTCPNCDCWGGKFVSDGEVCTLCVDEE